MATTSAKTNHAHLQTQCSTQRRGAGIILAILGVLFLLGTSAARRAQAQTFTVLHNFAGHPSDGATPFAGLLRDSSGNLYGTTDFGGTSNNCPGALLSVPDGCGTVFELDTMGALTVLHSFSGSDGTNLAGRLVRDSSGNLYGTTYAGGTSANCVGGCGTIFELDTSGTLTVLHNFDGGTTDGANPYTDLVRDSAGNLYGTTWFGGSFSSGTVFKLDTSHTLTVLHSFSWSEGILPSPSLVMDSSGNFYGTNAVGGPDGNGTVFKVDTSGSLTVLHSFLGGNDGAGPGGLVRDSVGNLYGTTSYGGTSANCSSGCGTVFKLDTSGTLTVLHNFDGGTTDGANPAGTLLRDSAGNLYGTTAVGGSYTGTSTDCLTIYGTTGCGTVFKLDTSGALTVLHSFSGSDGDFPQTNLVMDSSGNLYGTTMYGGTSTNCSDGCGTVFEISTTPQGASQALITQVNSLTAQGVINSGQNSSLVIKLQQAIDMINAGNINGAIGTLEGFIGEVNALENSGVLTGAQGSALTSAATSVVQQLQAM